MAKILIVDDAAFMRIILSNIFTKAGHEVVEVGNVDEAIEQYKKARPDLVTMDITMPGLDGIEGVKQIIKIDPQAQIIIVSVMGQQVMIMDAITAGAKDYIAKPFQEGVIINVIERLICQERFEINVK